MRLVYVTLLVTGCIGRNDRVLTELDTHDADPRQPASPDTSAQATLSPTGLTFALLPVDSIRGEISGHDLAADRCVRVIWDYDYLATLQVGKHCDDFIAGFPYVFIANGSCDADIRYEGNVDFVSATGCVDFGDFGGASTNLVDVAVEVSGPVFTGTLLLKGP